MENQNVDLVKLFFEKDRLHDQMCARNQYARRGIKGYSYAAIPCPEYLALMEEPNKRMNELILQILDEQDRLETKGPEKFRKEDVFVWGGPTNEWSGCMDPDTSIKGMKYFGAENVVYVYGALNEETVAMHRECKKLVCQLSRTSRSVEQVESDAECAEKLSLLSLKYPNIIGGIADDLVLCLGYNYSVKDIQLIRESLKKHNDKLDLYGVVYARELDHVNIPQVAACLDVVNLWIDRKCDLTEFDMIIEKCRVRFPGKKIMLGVFMQDIGLSDLGYSSEVMLRFLGRAERAYRNGKIQQLVILGDREIAKFPELAKTIKEFFAERWN